MFNKIVIIEPINVFPVHLEKIKALGKETICFNDIPLDDHEIVKRINDADCVLLSYT